MKILAVTLLSAAVLIPAFAETEPLAEKPALEPLVCPAPKEISLDAKTWVPLDGSVPVTVSCGDGRAAKWVRDHWKRWFGADVAVKADESADGPQGDEAYSLGVSPDCIAIRAAKLAGVRYALATLRQLSMSNRGTLKVTHYIAPAVAVRDRPSVAWRGLHFCWFAGRQPWMFERFIRIAAYLKFNCVVLETWGSFVSEKFPWLGWKDGAMTKAELQRLCAVADDLGVTLIPQVNVFGHASFSRGSVGKHATLDFAPEYQPLFEPIMGWNWCLSNPETKRVLREYVAEIHEAFGNPPYFHLGCDEAQPPSCPECAKGSYSDKVVRHIAELADVVEKRGARAIIWHDMFLRQLDPRYQNDYCNGSPAMAAKIVELPRSIVIADWNYGAPDDFPSLRHFHDLGFDVLACPWDNEKGIDAQGAFAQRNPWCGFLGTTWHHASGNPLRVMLVHDANAAWGGDPKPFCEPWQARIMTLLRHVGWDMKASDRTQTGVKSYDVDPFDYEQN